MIERFYYEALEDREIGHYFQIELGDDLKSEEWREHIALLVDFWATQFLEEERYRGDPYGPHFTMPGLKQSDFDRWVLLFSQAAYSLYIAEIAEGFKDKAVYYAQDFIYRLKAAKGEKGLKNLKSKISWEG